MAALVLLWQGGSFAAESVPAGDPAAWQRAEGQREWRFPRDHGQHPAYKLEWWYYTGLLRTESGRNFGFQVTFFRQGLRPPGVQPSTAAPPAATAATRAAPSAWRAEALYMGHAALSDLANGRLLAQGRFSRDGAGLAGAATDALRVWLLPWRADPLADDPHGSRLQVQTEDFGLDLAWRSPEPPVLHGQGGLDAKGAAAGQASWYYSLPRLRGGGTVTVGGETLPVTGEAWMDHEFGTNQLAEDQSGWDWFALRLDDGGALMLYRLRDLQGRPGAHSGGTWMPAAGPPQPFLFSEAGVRLTPGRTWRSPGSEASYPIAWQLRIERLDLDLRVEAMLDAQELPAQWGIPFPYWEGAVRAEGTRGGMPLTGEGYLEMTGYTGGLRGAFGLEEGGMPPASAP